MVIFDIIFISFFFLSLSHFFMFSSLKDRYLSSNWTMFNMDLIQKTDMYTQMLLWLLFFEVKSNVFANREYAWLNSSIFSDLISLKTNLIDSNLSIFYNRKSAKSLHPTGHDSYSQHWPYSTSHSQHWPCLSFTALNLTLLHSTGLVSYSQHRRLLAFTALT